MYELFQALLNTSFGETPEEEPTPAESDITAAPVAPDLDKCFEAVEQQLFDQG